MIFIQDIINTVQDLRAQVPEFIQPLVVMLAGAVAAIEGDVAAMIGSSGCDHRPHPSIC